MLINWLNFVATTYFLSSFGSIPFVEIMLSLLNAIKQTLLNESNTIANYVEVLFCTHKFLRALNNPNITNTNSTIMNKLLLWLCAQLNDFSLAHKKQEAKRYVMKSIFILINYLRAISFSMSIVWISRLYKPTNHLSGHRRHIFTTVFVALAMSLLIQCVPIQSQACKRQGYFFFPDRQ